MAKTLSNGLQVMEQGDSGETFFKAFNQNAIITNQITAGERSGQQAETIEKTINPSDWQVNPTGGYIYTLTWTDDLNGDNAVFNLFLLPTNERIYPSYTVMTKSITVKSIVNTISVKIHAISL